MRATACTAGCWRPLGSRSRRSKRKASAVASAVRPRADSSTPAADALAAPGAPDYASFVIRWRRPSGRADRIDVEHIQSGERTHVTSIARALEWMDRHLTPDKTGD